MNLELILAFIVGAIIGGGITFKLLPGFLNQFLEKQREMNYQKFKIKFLMTINKTKMIFPRD